MITAPTGQGNEVLKSIYVPKDIEALCRFEEMHRAHIEIPGKVKPGETFDVRIEVGDKDLHPGEPGHFIEWIEAYFGSAFLFRVNLSPGRGRPRVAVPVKLPGGAPSENRIRVWYKCTRHGIWEREKDIEIVH